MRLNLFKCRTNFALAVFTFLSVFIITQSDAFSQVSRCEMLFSTNSHTQLILESKTQAHNQRVDSSDVALERKPFLESDLVKVKPILRRLKFPQGVYLTTYKDQLKNTSYLVLEKVLVLASGVKKVEKTILKTQFGQIIDATLASGREFSTRLLNESVGSVFIFIDVNNLGFVNKNFQLRKKAGDLYIALVAEVLQKEFGDAGFIFRIGGDEFGVVMPHLTPQELVIIQNKIIAEVKSKAQELFNFEKNDRNENVTSLALYRQLGLLSEAEFQKLKKEYEDFLPYSQAGLSVGVEYIRNAGQASKVQSLAEDRATQMKVATKNALGLDTSKYTGQKVERSPDFKPDFNFKFDIPEITEMSQKLLDGLSVELKNQEGQLIRYYQASAFWQSESTLQWKFKQQAYRVGQFVVDLFVSEASGQRYIARRLDAHGVLQNKEEDVYDLELNANTHMFNGLTSPARALITEFFKNQEKNDRGGLYIDFKGLAEINYLWRGKTQDGDRILGLIAQVIRKQMRQSDISFKMSGSSYLVLFDQYGSKSLEKIKERILFALKHDREINQFFDQEIAFLRSQLEKSTAKEQTEILTKINKIEAILNNQSLFSIDNYSLSGESSEQESQVILKRVI